MEERTRSSHPKEHDERTRADLLSNAEALLDDEGVEAISVRRLAREVGTSTRAVYSVFGDKEGLFRALYQRSFVSLVEALEAAPEVEDPRQNLLRIGLLGFRQYALAHPNLFQLVFERAVPDARRSPEDHAVALEALQVLRSRVERCAEAGLIPRESVDVVTSAFHALCQGLASMELTNRLPLPGGGDPLRVWEDALTALIAGFACSTSSRQ